jgi:hypothetical protein
MLSRRLPLPAVGFAIGSAWACIVNLPGTVGGSLSG